MNVQTIGYVKSDADESTSPDSWASVESRIVLDPAFTEGLTGLEAGKEILVVFWFDRSKGFDLMQHPKGDTSRPKRGVFTLRSPHRPNPIGVSQVQLHWNRGQRAPGAWPGRIRRDTSARHQAGQATVSR